MRHLLGRRKYAEILLCFLILGIPVADADSNCMSRVLSQLLQNNSSSVSKADIAVVDIGSSTVKVLIKKGKTGEVISHNYKIALGESLGRSGNIDESAYQSLLSGLKNTQGDLDQYGISAVQVRTVATAGIRDAKNSEKVIERLKNDGFEFQVLTEQEEAQYVYQAVLRRQSVKADRTVVIEVGGGSTEVAVGKTVLEIDHGKSATVSVGSGSLGMRDPFNIRDVEIARKKTRQLLQERQPKILKKDEGKIGYVTSNAPYRALREIHLRNTGKDLFETGMSDQWLNYYLSKEGLSKLKQAHEDPLFSNYQELIPSIPSKLLIAREAKDHYRLADTLKFGSGGGMREAIAAELEAVTISNRIAKSSEKMARQWTKKEQEIVEDLKEVFHLERYGRTEFRVKSSAGIEDKLTSKWIGGKLMINQLRARKAEKSIGDGLGGRLILDATDSKTISAVHARLLNAVKERRIDIVEIHNFRGPGGIPYFNERQIEALFHAVQEASGKSIVVSTGNAAEKASGYTALHLNLKDRRGVPIEFQIRGDKISKLSDREHELYDFRRGKTVDHLDPEIVRAMKALKQKEYEALMAYLRECYDYARRLELRQKVSMPMFPAELAKYPQLRMDRVIQ